MTISIEIINNVGPMPRATRMVLTCDADHGLFPVMASFEHPDGFVGQHHLAMQRGWKDTAEGGYRFFYGPCCSGKHGAPL